MARPADDARRTRFLTVFCGCVLALVSGAPAASAQDAGAAGNVPTADQLAAATAEQVAAATATATQQAPQNIAIPVQILSPGDTGPITQVNSVSADAAATNSQAPPPPAPASPPAATPPEDPAPVPAPPQAPAPTVAQPAADSVQQSATATAGATQTAPVNVYIPISVLSPGDHGPVTQINNVSAQATATNSTRPGGQPAAAAPATAAPAAQTAGAGASGAQEAPANVAAPVTIGGTDVGEHPASTPWIWTWVWQLDCSAGAAPPDTGMLAPIISQVTGGAWEWHWTWTCGSATGAPQDAPGAGAVPQGQPPAAAPEPATASPAGTAPAAATPGAAPTAPSAASGVAPPSRRGARAAGRSGGILAPSALLGAGNIAGLLVIPADITPSAVISPVGTAHSARAHTGGTAPAPVVPDPRPSPPAPPVLAAGASGGSGGAPLSIGLAALIGAFLLTVPRLGTRARTQLVHRSAQAVPDPKDRPG